MLAAAPWPDRVATLEIAFRSRWRASIVTVHRNALMQAYSPAPNGQTAAQSRGRADRARAHGARRDPHRGAGDPRRDRRGALGAGAHRARATDGRAERAWRRESRASARPSRSADSELVGSAEAGRRDLRVARRAGAARPGRTHGTRRRGQPAHDACSRSRGRSASPSAPTARPPDRDRRDRRSRTRPAPSGDRRPARTTRSTSKPRRSSLISRPAPTAPEPRPSHPPRWPAALRPTGAARRGRGALPLRGPLGHRLRGVRGHPPRRRDPLPAATPLRRFGDPDAVRREGPAVLQHHVRRPTAA